MPFYEYRCKSCGSEFEAKRSIPDRDAEIHCPECAELGQRLMSSFAATNGPGLDLPSKVIKRGTW